MENRTKRRKSGCFLLFAALAFLIFGALPISAAAKTGFVTQNGKSYYINKDGSKHKGWLELNGKKYYFNKTTGVQVKGWAKDSAGKKLRYFTLGSGAMATGYLTDKSGNTRYFDKSTGILQRGWMKDSKGNQYYFSQGSGVMAKGWLTNAKGQKRYFNSKTGIMAVGWVKNSKDQYRFFNKENGIMYTGLKKISGNIYYFSKTDGIRYQKGFGTADGKKYYFSPSNGKAKTGWLTLDNKKYYFDSSGVMYVSTTATIDGKAYTFDKNGVASLSKYEIVDGDVKIYDSKNKKYYYMRKEYLEHKGVADGTVSDLDLLAAVCEAEAGNQGLVGMEAVALCILNRTIESSKCFPSEVRYVLYQTKPLQYAVVNNGTLLKRLNGQFDNRTAAYKAAKNAMDMFDDYVKKGTPRKLTGFDRKDFNFHYFMMEDSFWKMNLNFEKVDKFLYKDHMFFVDWTM